MVIVLVLIAALSQIGVQTTSLLAVLGTAGLAIGLALQGTLSNIAAGIMLIWLRPFRIGDYVEVVAGNPIAGTVREIGLFASLIETYDEILVFAPNSTIWNFPLRNHTRNQRRLLSFAVGLPEKSDFERACAVLLGWLAADPRVLKKPPPDVSSIVLTAVNRRWSAGSGQRRPTSAHCREIGSREPRIDWRRPIWERSRRTASHGSSPPIPIRRV